MKVYTALRILRVLMNFICDSQSATAAAGQKVKVCSLQRHSGPLLVDFRYKTAVLGLYAELLRAEAFKWRLLNALLLLADCPSTV